MDQPARHDNWSELQANAKLLEGDRHGRESGAWLHDRKRELAAGEEARFLAVYCDQIGLGKNLQEVLGLKRLDDGAEIDVRTKHEQVEDVVDGLGAVPFEIDVLGAESAELSGGDGTERIRAPYETKFTPSCVRAVRSTSANFTCSRISWAPTGPKVSTFTTFGE